MVRVGIVGGTGYTGVELLRILAFHPEVSIQVITSRGESGKRVDALYPHLRGVVNTVFLEPSSFVLEQCDVVFFATPHGTAMRLAPLLLEKGVKIIDLSADFRLKDPHQWAQWYGEPHLCEKILEKAVYGLPETHRAQIKTAQLIACPGCYPTAVQLGWLPLLEAGLIDPRRLIADVKSGVSGAGRRAEVSMLMSERGESFKAYHVQGHRHVPEIEQELQKMAKQAIQLTFVPHLLPMIRGIHATLYAELVHSDVDIQALYAHRYAHEPFVDVLPADSHPDTCHVRASNRCQIAVHVLRSHVIVLSVIDNLTKGAAGQAVQAMNILFGIEETVGLPGVGIYP